MRISSQPVSAAPVAVAGRPAAATEASMKLMRRQSLDIRSRHAGQEATNRHSALASDRIFFFELSRDTSGLTGPSPKREREGARLR